MSWETSFAAPVLATAAHDPVLFLQILTRRAEHYPEAIQLFADAAREMGERYHAEADKLDAVKAAREAAR